MQKNVSILGSALLVLSLALVIVMLPKSDVLRLNGQLTDSSSSFDYATWFKAHFAASAPGAMNVLTPSGADALQGSSSSAPSTANPFATFDSSSSSSDPVGFLDEVNDGSYPSATASASSSPDPLSDFFSQQTSVASTPESIVPVETSSTVSIAPLQTSMTDTSVLPPPTTAPSCNFTDVKRGTLEQTAAFSLCQKGIVKGLTPDQLRPGESLTRAQIATLIMRTKNPPESFSPESPFSDVNSSSWYFLYVAAAKQEGVITGYEDGTFHPDAPVTRAELATMVVRAFGVQAHLSDSAAPKDVLDSDWYAVPVRTALSNDLFPGDPGKFSPNVAATRSVAIIAIYRVLGGE